MDLMPYTFHILQVFYRSILYFIFSCHAADSKRINKHFMLIKVRLELPQNRFRFKQQWIISLTLLSSSQMTHVFIIPHYWLNTSQIGETKYNVA